MADPQTLRANPPAWYVLQGEYSRMEQLVLNMAKSPRLSIHLETVFNFLNLADPYRPEVYELPEAILEQRLTAIRMVYYVLEQLIAADPLLLPDDYAITNEEGYLRLTDASRMGIAQLRDDSMAPGLPAGTRVVWHILKPGDWSTFSGVVSVIVYQPFDSIAIGRMVDRTNDSFVLKRENPAFADLLIQWSNVLRIVSYDVLVGEKIQ